MGTSKNKYSQIIILIFWHPRSVAHRPKNSSVVKVPICVPQTGEKESEGPAEGQLDSTLASKINLHLFFKVSTFVWGTIFMNLKTKKMRKILCLFGAFMASLATYAQTPITLNKTNITGRV